MERVLAPENLRQAWHPVKAHHGAPGVEGMTSEDCPALARAHWASLRQVRKLTGRSWSVALASRIRKLNEYIRGWLYYFGLSQYYHPLPELAAWLRRPCAGVAGSSGARADHSPGAAQVGDGA